MSPNTLLERAQRAATEPTPDTLADGRRALQELRGLWPGLDAGQRAELAQQAKDAAAALAAAQASLAPDPDSLLGLMGLDAFRPGQREAVQALLAGRDSLVVMPTGGGKSLCYQLPALAASHLTVVVSPLIALMADQHRRLAEHGHPAVMFSSAQDEDTNRRSLAAVRDGTARIAFAAPERFAAAGFRDAIARRGVGAFVVDEAHCLAEQGHDFRPDYLRLAGVLDELGRPPVMACTATATPAVAEEICRRLKLRDPVRVNGGFDRPNLSFDVLTINGGGAVARKDAILHAVIDDPANRPAIVYCGTRKATDDVAQALKRRGVRAVGYHAGMSDDERRDAQRAFMAGTADVVAATNAFGMGVDKADVRCVVHYALPSSVEAYYQEAGRAGRDGQPARALLLAMRADLGRLVHFIKQAEVDVADVQALVGRIRQAADPDGRVEMEEASDDHRVQVAIAERAGALRLLPGPAGRAIIEIAGPLDAAAAARACREARNRRWEAYRALETFTATGDRCRRRQLLDHFSDPAQGAPQGRCCDVCDPPTWLPDPGQAPPGRRSRSSSNGRKGGQVVEQGRDVTDAELEPLRAWRRERADGKPAYTVAADRTLREIARRRPESKLGLSAIHGIGPAFMDRHADSLLEALKGLPPEPGQ